MNIWTKTTLGIIGALVLGALGNGVWEYVLQPTLSWMFKLALSIGTLGVHAYKDEMYREIARGFHEESSLSLATSIYLMLSYAAAIVLYEIMARAKRLEGRAADLQKDLERLEGSHAGEEAEDADAKNDPLARVNRAKVRLGKSRLRLRRMRNVSRVLFAFGIVFLAWIVIGSARDRYINTAIVYYEQSMRIVAPFAKESELVMFRSRFARITSKEDYAVLMADISGVAARGNIRLRSFDAW